MFAPIPLDTNILTADYARATKALLLVNVLVFLVTSSNPDLETALALNVDSSISYRFLTYQFVHADFMHILFNMIFLLPFAAILEDKVGQFKMVVFYLVGGVVAGVVWQMLSDLNGPGLVGASGSLSALVGACLVLRPKLPLTGLLWIFIFIHFFRLPVWVWALYFLIQDFVLLSMRMEGEMVAYEAHLGGFIGNFILCVLALRLGYIRSASSDLLGSFGIRTQNREQSSDQKLKSEMGFRDVSTVDHVIDDLENGQSHKYDVEKLLILSRNAVNSGRAVEGYKILQTWIEQNEADSQTAQVAYEIALICLRHLNKKDLARDWLADASNRNPDTVLQNNITMMMEAT